MIQALLACCILACVNGLAVVSPVKRDRSWPALSHVDAIDYRYDGRQIDPVCSTASTGPWPSTEALIMTSPNTQLLSTTSSAAMSFVAPTLKPSSPASFYESNSNASPGKYAAHPSTTSAFAVAPQGKFVVAVSGIKSSPTRLAGSAQTATHGPGLKKGLGFDDVKYLAAFSGAKNLSWAYDWRSYSKNGASGLEYVPMLWDNRPASTTDWFSNVNRAITAGSTAVLGFNEPDHAEQANIPYDVAASSYRTLISQPLTGKVRLGSVAVTNGGEPMGLSYLRRFMQACADCNIDFVVVHWYDSATNIQYFKEFVTQAHEQTQRPVWITEFGCTSGSSDEIDVFIRAVVPWLDQQTFVERYSYFMAAEGLLNSGYGLNSHGQNRVGNIYGGTSSSVYVRNDIAIIVGVPMRFPVAA